MVWSSHSAAPSQEDQAWYLLEGSARTAAAEAKAVMAAAMQARSLMGPLYEKPVVYILYGYGMLWLPWWNLCGFVSFPPPKKNWYGSNGLLMHPLFWIYHMIYHMVTFDHPTGIRDQIASGYLQGIVKRQAKSDLIAAIDHGLIKTSYDYAAIESTLVPTMALPLGSHIRCGCGDP